MQKIFGENYIRLGEEIQSLRIAFHILDSLNLDSPDTKPERLERYKSDLEQHQNECRQCMKNLIKTCEELGLARSQELVSGAYDDLPQSRREFELLVKAVAADVKQTFFLFIPAHLVKYYENQSFLSEKVKERFPSVSFELNSAANCLATGFSTASVFHSMRAAEIGLRALGRVLNVCFPDIPLEQADMMPIIAQAESKIRKMQDEKKSPLKDEALNFYSQAAAQFRYFKDGWRVRAQHGRAVYDESEAIRVLEHCRDFFESIAPLLTE